MNHLLRSERLALVVLDASSAPLVLDYVNRNRIFLEPWEMARTEDYFTLAYQTRIIEEDVQKIKEGQLWKVWLLLEDRIIGSVALSNIVRGAFQSCHLGYRMDEQEQGKGYMTEALKAVVAYAFDAMKLHRIEANIMPRNAASLQVVKKLGFYEEGLALKYLNIHGVWEDHYHMVLRNHSME